MRKRDKKVGRVNPSCILGADTDDQGRSGMARRIGEETSNCGVSQEPKHLSGEAIQIALRATGLVI